MSRNGPSDGRGLAANNLVTVDLPEHGGPDRTHIPALVTVPPKFFDCSPSGYCQRGRAGVTLDPWSRGTRSGAAGCTNEWAPSRRPKFRRERIAAETRVAERTLRGMFGCRSHRSRVGLVSRNRRNAERVPGRVEKHAPSNVRLRIDLDSAQAHGSCRRLVDVRGRPTDRDGRPMRQAKQVERRE